MDMHPPPAYVQLVQVPAPAQDDAQPQTPVEPTPIKVDVSRYIPAGAILMTIIVTLTPPTGQALVYTEGAENYGTVFKGGRSVGDIRLDGPLIYVKLYGATSFDIQYLNYRVP